MRQLGNINPFKETRETITITMGGWDGTGYHGEGKKMKVWRNDTHPNEKFVCKYMSNFKAWCILKVDESNLHKESNLPMVDFYCDFEKSEMQK